MNFTPSIKTRSQWWKGQWVWKKMSLPKLLIKRNRSNTQPQDNSCPVCTCVVCGCESVGKTQLLTSLTGRLPLSENFRGSTVACETYYDGNVSWADTPGIVRESETSATRSTIEQISSADRVMLVTRADRVAEELPSLLNSIAGKLGFIALTFADRIPESAASQAKKLSKAVGVQVFPVDARQLNIDESQAIRNAAMAPSAELGSFPLSAPHDLPVAVHSEKGTRSIWDKLTFNPLTAFLLLFLPAIISIMYTNGFADWLYTPLSNLLDPILKSVEIWPSLAGSIIGGDYGLLSMFPFLVLYAVPTIVVFSAILAVYKSTGLIDRLSYALHPWLRPVGIGGRDLVRVVMGFGCNVPAIVSSRSCHSCSRGACVSAISFGSACSYQLPATLAVFAAAGMVGMGLVYLVVLALTTLIYLRFTTPKILRLASNAIVAPPPESLSVPSWRMVWREVLGNLKSFVVMAFPVFVIICVVASLLNWLGAFDVLSTMLSPLLACFNLPGDAASAVVLGSIRKDGIAIGLLGDVGGALKVALTTPAQVLTAVYLSGVLLPCLVTVFTIIREMRWKFAVKLCARQMLWAAGFAVIIAWGGKFLLSINI